LRTIPGVGPRKPRRRSSPPRGWDVSRFGAVEPGVGKLLRVGALPGRVGPDSANRDPGSNLTKWTGRAVAAGLIAEGGALAGSAAQPADPA